MSEHDQHLTAMHAAAAAAVAAAPIPGPLPENVKAVIRPVVPVLVNAFVQVAQIGVDAALAKVPFVGGMLAGIVNPIVAGLAPSMIAWAENWLA